MSVIAGVVQDARGRPVVDARVYFSEGPGALPDIAALTDSAGAFELSAPREGRYVIGCSAEGFESSARVVTIAGTPRVDVRLRLERA